MIYRIFVLAFILLLGVTQTTFAESFPTTGPKFIPAFREYAKVPVPSILVPTVVEMPISIPNTARKDFLVVDNEYIIPIQSYLKEVYTITPATFYIFTPGGAGAPTNLSDKNFSTGVYYSYTEGGEMTAEITFTTTEPVKVSGFNLALERNVSLPATVEVSSFISSTNPVPEILLAKSRMTSGTVAFIPTVASTFVIKFTYVQPLQINELSLIQTDVEKSLSQSLRFLAQPNTVYYVYQNPDSAVNIDLINSINLQNDVDILKITPPEFRPNPRYVQADGDSDGVADTVDNCVSTPNPDQEDIDSNGRGDVCDDWDRDRVVNSVDNCINSPNTNQSDEDGDGIGDVCDEEESRFTERNKWVPWAGMGIAAMVLLGMFALVAKRPLTPPAKLEEEEGEPK